MLYDPDIHHRRSIRLQGYDYSQSGAYFITICTQDKKCLFGKISTPIDGYPRMVLNDAGKMVQTIWDEIPSFYPEITTDEFVIMPNHIHGIIMIVGKDVNNIVGATPRGCPPPTDGNVGAGRNARQNSQNQSSGQPRGVAPTMSLADAVHRFKTMTTKRYADGVKQNGWLPFPGKLWQRNYWEHVVRDESDLHEIREYIVNNPAKWEFDKLYVA
jgi:putative transposase